MNMMPNQQGPQQGPQSTQLKVTVQQQQQQIHQQLQQQQQQQQQQQLVQHQQQLQQPGSQSSQQQSQSQQPTQPSQAIYLPQSVGPLIPQQIMIQPNTHPFTAMPNSGNLIQMAQFGKKPVILPNDIKGPRSKMQLISSGGPHLQSINNFVTGQSPQTIGNQYYTLQTFPSPGGPVQQVNSATLLSPNNQHQYLLQRSSDLQFIAVSNNAFPNQQIVMNGVPISVGNNATPVISLASNHARTATKTTSSGPNTGQPCLIAPATNITAQNTIQRLKAIKPATENNRTSIGTQTAPGQSIVQGSSTPVAIPIHLPQQQFQLQLAPQPHPAKKSSKNNFDTMTTVTLVSQRNNTITGNTNNNIINNTNNNNTPINNVTPNNMINKSTTKSNKLTTTNAPLKEKVIQSPKKKATTTGTDTGDLVDHCSESNNLTNGVNKSTGSKSPQRAIVKPYINDPNVLTHVIDGFVIQESPSPFVVNADGLEVGSDETIIDSIDERENKEDTIMLDTSDNNNLSTETQTIKTKPKGESTCETCKKTISKFNKKKKLKRFCSNVCAKKSNNNLHNNSNNINNRGDEINGDIITESTKQSSQPASKKLKTDVSPNCKVTETTEPLDSSIDGGYIPPGGTNPNLWSVQDVYDFVRHLPGCQEYADEFKSQEIDGQALMLLKEDHLMSAMSMKLGPALKICSRITSLFKAEANKSQA